MRFTVNQLELNNALGIVSKAVSSKSIIFANGIYLEAKENRLRLVTNDSTLSIDTYIEAEVESEGKVIVPKTILIELIRKLPNTRLLFSLEKSNKQLNVSASGMKYDMNVYEEDDFRLVDFKSKSSIEIEKDLLSSLITQTEFAVSRDSSKPPVTMGILFEIDNDTLNVVALDGYRLAYRKTKIKSSQNASLIIPAKSLRDVRSIAQQTSEDAPVRLSYNDTHAMIEISNIKIITTLIAGDYIKYKQLIPLNSTTTVTVRTTDLRDSIERINIITRESRNSTITLDIKDEFIEIKTRADIGSAVEKVEIDLVGQELFIALNPQSMIEMLKIIETEEIVIYFTTETGACITKEKDNDDFIVLNLPLRISR